MVASDLISYEIPPLKITDNGDKALGWMEEFKVMSLPVIDNDKYIGVIEEKDVLDRSDVLDEIKTYNLNYKRPFVHQGQHLFEVMEKMVQNDIDVMPVVGDNENFLGLITSGKIISSFAKTTSIGGQGSIITLELNLNDYSLAEIAKLVESDDAKILASYVTSHVDSTKLEVTLKINKTEITRILHTFERFNYNITASYNETEYHEDLQRRYDEFLRFLNT
ncbi:CBS domain-containing protein [bacterium]|nr:CBS domain-containing protein [bacterium]